MKTNPIKFGTDGWRAVIAREFTFDNVRICAQAVSEYLIKLNLAEKGLVVGYDTRFASEDFAAAVAEVVTANGIKVFLSPKALPTPEVSFGVVHQKAGGAVIITASHNPAAYNGFKIKSPDGSSAPSEIIDEVERNIVRIFDSGTIKQIPLNEASKKGMLKYRNFDAPYFDQLSRFVEIDTLKNNRLKVVVDSMYGAGSGYFRNLLEGGAIEIIDINSERNPSFPGINPEPIAVNLKKLSARVLAEGAQVGLATDGDSDRIGIIDEHGNFITQLQTFALLSLYLLETRGQRGAIIKTLTSSRMMDRLGEIYGVKVIETPVGFKYVGPAMLENDALIGGEESGGYGFRGHVPERDAILAGLYFLDFMTRTGKTPAQLLEYLFSKVGPNYYDRRDFHFPPERRQEIIERVRQSQPGSISGIKVSKRDAVDGFRFILEDNSWLLIRFSGTEPLLRIYAESSSMNNVEHILDAGVKLAGV